MSKYARPAIHAAYTLAAGLALFVTTDAGRSFISNHPAVAGAVPVLVAVFRAFEQAKRSNSSA